MALTAIASSVFNATRSSTDDLASVVEASSLPASAASSGATLSYTYTSLAAEPATVDFDLRALTDDRGTLTFTAVHGIIVKVRAGILTTVDPAALPAGALTCQPCGSGGSIVLLPLRGVYAVASATSIGTVDGSSYLIRFTTGASAQFDLYIWGEGTIA